jgi:tetratricopeptide (TPR) repeat protein
MRWLIVLLGLWVGSAQAASQIDSLNQQVLDLYNQGKFEEATPLCVQLVQLLEQKFGSDSLQFASGLNNLAELYVKQKKPEQAVPLYRRSLAIREAQLGPDHPDVAKSRARLAEVMPPPPPPESKRSGDERVANKPMPPPPQPRPNPVNQDMSRAMELNREAVQLGNQGKAKEAIPLAKQVLAIFEKDLGPDHPNVAIGLGNLAQLYAQTQQWDEALPLYQRALPIMQKRGNSPELGYMLGTIGDIYAQKRNFPEAESWYKRAIPVLPANDPALSRILNNMAEVYRAQGKVPELDPLMKGKIKPGQMALPGGKLSTSDPAKPPDSEDMAQAHELDQALFHLTEAKKYEDALPVALDLQALTERMYGASSLAAAMNLDRMAALYKAMGRDAEAQPLAARASAIRQAAKGAP